MSDHCLACGGPLGADPALVAPDRMHHLPGRWAIHECRDCGSGTTLPLVSEDELGAFYPHSYAPFDVPRGLLARLMGRLQRARNRRFPLSTLAKSTGGGPGTLLDVGCGRGDLAASWIAAGWTVLGVEPSPEAAATAARRGARIIGRTLSDAELPDASVDAVVFRHSLEHVIDPPRATRRAHAALRPHGRLAVIVPNWSSRQRHVFGQYWFPLELPRHRTHFTADGLRQAIGHGGFGEVRIEAATPLITTTWSLQFRLFDRLVTDRGPALLAGYAASAPVGAVAAVADRQMGGGDFLHAAAVKTL